MKKIILVFCALGIFIYPTLAQQKTAFQTLIGKWDIVKGKSAQGHDFFQMARSGYNEFRADSTLTALVIAKDGSKIETKGTFSVSNKKIQIRITNPIAWKKLDFEIKKDTLILKDGMFTLWMLKK